MILENGGIMGFRTSTNIQLKIQRRNFDDLHIQYIVYEYII